jgi:hypothetical protein
VWRPQALWQAWSQIGWGRQIGWNREASSPEGAGFPDPQARHGHADAVGAPLGWAGRDLKAGQHREQRHGQRHGQRRG